MSYWAMAVSGIAGAIVGGGTVYAATRYVARRSAKVEPAIEAPPPADDSVRERAKAATLVVSVVTVLVGADPLDIRGSSNTFQILDYGLIAGWLIVIFLFFFVQTAKVAEEHRLQRALGATAIALALTALLLVAKPFGLSSDSDTVVLEVKDQELATITGLCQRKGQELNLYGDVLTESLGDEFIVLKLNPRANSTCTEIKVPREQIIAFVEHPCDQEHGVISGRADFCRRKAAGSS